MPQKSIRTFIALEIEDAAKDRICEIQDKIKLSNSIKGSWVAKNNLHLTLKFLGDTRLKYVEAVKDKIAECCKGISSIKCELVKIGIFPEAKSPRVIWVGIKDETNVIANLSKKIEENIFELGFKKEKRDFKTHITICRPRQILNPDQFRLLMEELDRDFKAVEFNINKLTFFESKLTPQGSIYTPLNTYILR